MSEETSANGAVIDRGGTTTVPAIEVVAAQKVYGPTTALAGVDFRVGAGEIHGLVGENGAGKSTLVRILSGVESPDQGRLRFFGEPASGGPAERRNQGLVFIHQDLGLFRDMSVAETIALSCGFRLRFGLINHRATTRFASEVTRRIGFECDVRRPVGEFSLADQTLVAISRALASGARLIVLDEPTAYLEARQVRQVFDILARLRDDGVTAVLISHRSEDILRVCDRVTVLRDGKSVAKRSTHRLTEQELIHLITGHDDRRPVREARAKDPTANAARLQVKEIVGPGFGPVSLAVASGEVVGLCGLADAGQFALGRALVGDLALSSGTATIDGSPYEPSDICTAIEAGIAFVPADRRIDGLAGSLSAVDNMMMAPAGPWWRPVRSGKDSARARQRMHAFRVFPPAPERDVDTFSGGNQQKILLAKWMSEPRRILVLNEPSAGVDVVAKADIHDKIRSTCRLHGSAALVISTDFQEIAAFCDRAVVLRHGHAVGELSGPELHADTLAELAYGGSL